MRVIFKIVFLLLAVKSFSQNNYTPKVIPPSPEAASLGKYVETPVSYATGIPQIGVPIYTISEGNINVPVSLSYHAGGNRVEETASSVGLGWSLIAGGVITRTVKDEPDDSTTFGLIQSSYTINQFIQNTPDSFNMTNILDQYDFEPDEFVFNFGNYSGKFAYNQATQSFFQMPKSNIKIVPVFESSKITSFVVTTPDGYKYYFGKSKNGLRNAIDVSYPGDSFTIDNSGAFLTPNESPDFNSSWYLLDIEDTNGKIMNFFYVKQISQNEYVRTGQDVTFGIGGCDVEQNAFVKTHFSYISNDANVLKTISSTEGKIDFEYDTSSREDLIGGKRLKKIKIYRTSATTPIKEFELYHDYFTTQSSANDPYLNIMGSYSSTYYKRLKLLSVLERGVKSDGTTEAGSPYLFEYNSTSLPYKLSNAQDYWGYYNGIENNPNLIAYAKSMSYYPIQYLEAIQGNADRSTDVEKCKAAVLTKITYPTGGKVEYEYENNKASSSNIIYKYDNREFNLRNRLENKTVEIANSSNFAIVNVLGDIERYETTFTVSEDVIGYARVSTQVSGCDNTSPISMDCDFIIHIEGIDNGNSTFSRNLYGVSRLELAPGTYKIIAIPNYENGETPNFYVGINWGEDPTPEYLNVGSLRVKKINLYDKDNNLTEKKYDYLTSLDGVNLISSGFLISTPITIDDENAAYSTHGIKNGFAIKIFSNSSKPLSSTQVGSLVYSEVHETINESLLTEYDFDTSGDYFLNVDQFRNNVVCVAAGGAGGGAGLINTIDFKLTNYFKDPFNDVRSGNLTERREYKQNAIGVYDLIQKTENTYEDFGREIIPYFGIVSVHMPQCEVAIKEASYPQTTFYHRPKKTTVTKYFNTGDVTQITENFYENNPLLPSKVVTSNSTGDSIETKYFYPPDDEMTSKPNRTTLIAKNMIGSPLVTQTFNGTEKLSEQETQYGTFPSAIAGQNILLPQNIYAAKFPNTLPLIANVGNLEKKITFNSYDTKGNITQYTQENGVPVSIIWGYNKTQPVAKLENIAYNSIPAALITAIQSVTDSAISTEAQVITALNALRSSSDATMVNAMISTYTYKPLVGVSTITDPKGDTQTFTYDPFGRLQNVKDKNGNIVSENEYHYRP